MKVSTTEYGTASIIKKQKNNEPWNCEKLVSFIITGLTIICVCGYIIYSNDKSISKSILKNTNKLTTGTTTNEQLHGQHVYDFDLSSSSSQITITHCEDDDDTSYDIEYGEYTYENDIKAVTNGIINHWDEFEQSIRKSVTKDDTFIQCLHNEMRNGNIFCKMTCTQQQVTYISTMDNTINFCEDSSLDLLNQELRPNRRACIFKEIAFQFSNLCAGGHSPTVSTAAFKWYKTKYDGSQNWKITDCP
eukprot:391636_1